MPDDCASLTVAYAPTKGPLVICTRSSICTKIRLTVGVTSSPAWMKGCISSMPGSVKAISLPGLIWRRWSPKVFKI